MSHERIGFVRDILQVQDDRHGCFTTPKESLVISQKFVWMKEVWHRSDEVVDKWTRWSKNVSHNLTKWNRIPSEFEIRLVEYLIRPPWTCETSFTIVSNLWATPYHHSGFEEHILGTSPIQSKFFRDWNVFIINIIQTSKRVLMDENIVTTTKFVLLNVQVLRLKSMFNLLTEIILLLRLDRNIKNLS